MTTPKSVRDLILRDINDDCSDRVSDLAASHGVTDDEVLGILDAANLTKCPGCFCWVSRDEIVCNDSGCDEVCVECYYEPPDSTY